MWFLGDICARKSNGTDFFLRGGRGLFSVSCPYNCCCLLVVFSFASDVICLLYYFASSTS